MRSWTSADYGAKVGHTWSFGSTNSPSACHLASNTTHPEEHTDDPRHSRRRHLRSGSLADTRSCDRGVGRISDPRAMSASSASWCPHRRNVRTRRRSTRSVSPVRPARCMSSPVLRRPCSSASATVGSISHRPRPRRRHRAGASLRPRRSRSRSVTSPLRWPGTRRGDHPRPVLVGRPSGRAASVQLDSITLVSASDAVAAGARRGHLKALATAVSRDLSNTPPAHLTAVRWATWPSGGHRSSASTSRSTIVTGCSPNVVAASSPSTVAATRSPA